MLSGGAELLAGVVQDPVFGPLVAFGPGGVLAELIGTAQFRSRRSPTSTRTSSIHAGKAGHLSPGPAPRPPSRRGALVDLMLRLSRLGEDLPEAGRST